MICIQYILPLFIIFNYVLCGEILKEERHNPTLETNEVETCGEDLNYKVHYYRLINILLTNIFIPEHNDHFLEGFIGIEASKEEYEILKNLQDNSKSLKEIDMILQKIITKPRLSFSERILLNLNPFINHVHNYKFLFYLVAVFVTFTFILWKFCLTNHSKIIFLLICIISYSWYITHQDMLTKVNVKQTVDRLIHSEKPDSCSPKTQKWYQQLWLYQFMFVQHSEEDCVRFVQSQMVPALTEVTLLMSLSQTFSNFIMEPILVYGKILKQFINYVTCDRNIFYTLLLETMIYGGHVAIFIFIITLMWGRLIIRTPFANLCFERNSPSLPHRIESAEIRKQDVSIHLQKGTLQNKTLKVSLKNIQSDKKYIKGYPLQKKSKKDKVKHLVLVEQSQSTCDTDSSDTYDTVPRKKETKLKKALEKSEGSKKNKSNTCANNLHCNFQSLTDRDNTVLTEASVADESCLESEQGNLEEK